MCDSIETRVRVSESPRPVGPAEVFRNFFGPLFFGSPRLGFLTDFFFLSPCFLVNPRSVTLTDVTRWFSDPLYFGTSIQYIRTRSSAWVFWVPLLCKSQSTYPGGGLSCFFFLSPSNVLTTYPKTLLQFIRNRITHAVLSEMLADSFQCHCSQALLQLDGRWYQRFKGTRPVSVTVERRLSERRSSETSNIRTHIFFVLR